VREENGGACSSTRVNAPAVEEVSISVTPFTV
jgi:hypothetical protein